MILAPLFVPAFKNWNCLIRNSFDISYLLWSKMWTLTYDLISSYICWRSGDYGDTVSISLFNGLYAWLLEVMHSTQALSKIKLNEKKDYRRIHYWKEENWTNMDVFQRNLFWTLNMMEEPLVPDGLEQHQSCWGPRRRDLNSEQTLPTVFYYL